jgi:hypothetical protein
MNRVSRAVLPVPVVLLVAAASYGQSLADVARRNRLAKVKNAATAKKVITTDDLSPDAQADPPKPEAYKTVGTSGFTPEMWKRAIEGKKKWIAFLESEKAKLDVEPNQDMQQVALDPQARKQSEERGIQRQFASEIPEQKKQLLEMCEEARKAGLPPEVWAAQ